MGKNTVLEILKHKKNILLKVLSCKSKEEDLIQRILKENIPVEFVNKKTLDNMTKTTSHQNIIAKIKPRYFYNLKDFLKIQEDKNSLVVMLDSIFDPQNFGSILRSCECFSVDGVVFSKNRGVDISLVVTKASQGASELLNLIKVSNLATTIKAFQDNGYTIVSTVLDKKSKKLQEYKFSDKTLLIMGSEGRGIQKILLEHSDQKIFIPMPGKLQSLNVSVATGIILSYIRF
jgi:23S rRNA (guanosine2251-2'-O)-methyltransferase